MASSAYHGRLLGKQTHPAAAKQFQELTRNDPLRIERFEGVVHKQPRGSGLIPSQFVLHNQRVVAVVDVGGLVEEETTVFH